MKVSTICTTIWSSIDGANQSTLYGLPGRRCSSAAAWAWGSPCHVLMTPVQREFLSKESGYLQQPPRDTTRIVPVVGRRKKQLLGFSASLSQQHQQSLSGLFTVVYTPTGWWGGYARILMEDEVAELQISESLPENARAEKRRAPWSHCTRTSRVKRAAGTTGVATAALWPAAVSASVIQLAGDLSSCWAAYPREQAVFDFWMFFFVTPSFSAHALSIRFSICLLGVEKN